MMKEKALKRQSILYLIRLECWQLLRWKRRLELLNETTNDLWLIREVLKEKRSEDSDVTTRDIREHTGIMTESYRKYLLNDSY